jgi:hypothetical protein
MLAARLPWSLLLAGFALSHASSKEDAAKFPKWEHRPFERHVSNTWHTARAGSRFPPLPKSRPFLLPIPVTEVISEGNFRSQKNQTWKFSHFLPNFTNPTTYTHQPMYRLFLAWTN